MASSLITSTGTVADAPGYGQNSHTFYAENSGLWWCFTFESASNTTLYARYSADNLATWSNPTNPTKALANSNKGHGACLGVAYANIASTDVVHIGLFYIAATSPANAGDEDAYIRATLSGTTVTWGAEAAIHELGSSASNATAIAKAVAVGSGGSVLHTLGADGTNGGDFEAIKSTNADAGTSWTAGYPGTAGSSTPGGTLLFSSTNTATSSSLLALSSGGKALALGDNGSTTGTPNQIVYSLYGGTSWSPANPATAVFATTASINSNDWGCCLRTDTDAHAVRRNDSTSTFTHRRWNGASWAAGDSVPSHTCLSGGGVALATDGTTVWLFIIDSAAGNAVQYCAWTAGGGWGSWTALESASQTRKFLTAWYSATQQTVAVCWSQTNGSNFDLTVEGLSTAAAAAVLPPRPIIVSQAAQRAAVR